VFGVIPIVEFENDGFLVLIDQIIFVEDGLRHHVFFRSPVAEVFQAATVAAEGEIRVGFGIGGSSANGATMFHKNGPVLD
jgi:hypothetical protein